MYFDPNGAWGGGVSTDAPAMGSVRGGARQNLISEATPHVSPKDADGSAGPKAAQPNTHIVKSGETLSSIAQAAYGSSAFYPHLLRANPGINPNNLKPGTAIHVPPATEVKATAAPGTAGKPAGELPPGPALVEETKIDPVRQYRVVSGDSLYKIGQKLYGKGTMGDRIYDANKQLIGADPRRLKLGMILQLPEPPTAGRAGTGTGRGSATASGGREEAWNSISNPSEPYFGNEAEKK
jgi:nucleoid-associated protein YgaU